MSPVIEPLEARIAPAFASIFSLASLDGANGTAILGAAAGDNSGYSVSAAGDVNGDGIADVVIGATGADPNGNSSGAVYVIFGRANGSAPTLDLAALSESDGFAIVGSAEGDIAGNSVRAAGDINGDGRDDLIVGAMGADANGLGSGAAYVIFGQESFPRVLALSTLDGTNGFRLVGAATQDSAGYSVSRAGDVNGDGIDDLIVGAPQAAAGGSLAGAAYVVFGSKFGFAADFALSSLNGSNGFRIWGVEDGDAAGTSVGAAGDVNGDGFDDVIIGAPLASPTKDSSGAGYVIFGHSGSFGADFALTALNGNNGFSIAGANAYDYAGYAVNGVGDINGDGFDDVVVGAREASPNGYQSGAAHVVFGKSRGFNADINTANLNGSNGFTLNGTAPYDYAGISVSAAGDVNGDGLADIIIGASGVRLSSGSETGAAYVVYGRTNGFNANLHLGNLNGNNGFQIAGTLADSSTAFSVSTAGDWNGDGIDDVIIGAYAASPNGRADAGISYIVFGQGSHGDGEPKPGEVTILKSGKLAVYIDVDGDLVKIKTTSGRFVPSDFQLRLEGKGAFLDVLDLSRQPVFAGTTLSIKASPGSLGGNGRVNVGAIDLSGIDIKKLSLEGNLYEIQAGDGNSLNPGIKQLRLGSFGPLDTPPSSESNDISHSVILGGLRSLEIEGNFAGQLQVAGGLGAGIEKISIDGNLTGHISTAGDIDAVKVRGSIAGGPTLSGISSGGCIQKLAVKGSVFSSGDPVLISALGTMNPTHQSAAMAIGKIKVDGNVQSAQFLAGFAERIATNPDASIGSVIVTGSWQSSDLVAGIIDATEDGFGRNDSAIGVGNPRMIAKIAKITVKGALIGSGATDDHFGLTAQHIEKVRLQGHKITLSPGPTDDLLLDSSNGDFRLIEVY